MTANVITYDWEFYEDGKRIHPISVGMKGIDGREYYAVFSDANYWSNKTKWLRENVNPHLMPDLLKHTEAVKERAQIVEEVIEFIGSYINPQLWAWYGAYDHVCLAQTLGGPMVSLPDGVPMFTNDIKTLQILSGPDWEGVTQPFGVINELPHHAMFDARYDMELYKRFMALIGA